MSECDTKDIKDFGVVFGTWDDFYGSYRKNSSSMRFKSVVSSSIHLQVGSRG